MTKYVFILMLTLAAPSCSNGATRGEESSGARPFTTQEVGNFDEPWAMTFLPDGRLLVTEKKGRLEIFTPSTGSSTDVQGAPKVVYAGQGGFGDVVLGPDFSTSGLIYLSWVEAGPNSTSGAVVGRARLVEVNGAARLENLHIIWKQTPKVQGEGHFSQRIVFSPDGQYMFIGSGERQQFDPAQDMKANLGKIVRLHPDGSVPPDNPFASRGGVAAQIWSLGHRNILGLAFDAEGRLWEQEMGPRGGDEVNLIKKGTNYGYPIVSNGDHYSGEQIPDHSTRPEFEKPKLWWNPSISPAGLMIYSGKLFPEWTGSLFMGALSGAALVRVALDGEGARKADHWDMGKRIREVEQGPDGSIWLLQDGSGGRLLKLSPRR
ncbi:PQQ-dependent sugar dehydrogenase [Rhizorhapis suberifaciens]|uniref:Glucose/arabinose dehydrogenase n=1 Tax=Rhizorhapis suberifaciens TaxID=13656 RepID=A0A840HQZ6_9SPHN|nr:PQQ-dependent sugar dehydrogenase [Rhizorhapis suberifaciens]MBB4640131.1 glucose/arabinose dehydrogenase [Rhizorhapis suberifaciens]